MSEEAPPRRAPGAAPALVYRRDGGRASFEKDTLAVEEPLEIRVAEQGGEPVPLLVTMRSPGDDEDLALGLLFSEGVIASAADVAAIGRPSDPRVSDEIARNAVVVTLASSAPGCRRAPRRATLMTSACGVCGRTSIEDVVASAPPLGDGVRVSSEVLTSLPDALRREQGVFSKTGGLHAAGLFRADGALVLAREDVGRHNATDKVIGAALRAGGAMPEVLLVSGRLAFEIVQKAVRARIPVVCAVSAPTSLAVELAEEAGVTVVGFLRGERFNVYTHPERIATGA